jgi:hypothetical protein
MLLCIATCKAQGSEGRGPGTEVLKIVVIKRASLENTIWLICRRRFPLFFQGVGKRLP